MVVVGAGVIGLSVAWKAAAAGARVVVCDPAPATGASWAAAGMLAPVTEATSAETDLAALGIESLGCWPGFAQDLESSTGISVGLRTEGTLAVAVDDDDRRALDELAAVQRNLGLVSERLSAKACRDLEPMLNPRVRAGLFVPGDHQVDNRRLLAALQAAARDAGAQYHETAVTALGGTRTRIDRVHLDDGRTVEASSVVLAAGCRSAGLSGIPDRARPPVRPVKGQILRLQAPPAEVPVGRTVRALVRGWSVYVVPRDTGEVVVGATMEERGYDTSVTAGAVDALLRAAIEVVPALGEIEFAEATARLRPATPDNGPILGPGPAEGLLYATGHHRNGILLAPITAQAVVAAANGAAMPAAAKPFTMERFA